MCSKVSFVTFSRYHVWVAHSRMIRTHLKNCPEKNINHQILIRGVPLVCYINNVTVLYLCIDKHVWHLCIHQIFSPTIRYFHLNLFHEVIKLSPIILVQYFRICWIFLGKTPTVQLSIVTYLITYLLTNLLVHLYLWYYLCFK